MKSKLKITTVRSMVDLEELLNRILSRIKKLEEYIQIIDAEMDGLHKLFDMNDEGSN